MRNVGASGYSDIALRDAIKAGDVPGPRMLVSGPPLRITGGHADNNFLAPQYHCSDDGVADGVDGVTLKVRENIKYGADVIKFMATGGVLSEGDNPALAQYSPEEMKAIVDTAHGLGRKVAAHAHGATGIKYAVLAGVDSIEHGSYINDEDIQLMKAARDVSGSDGLSGRLADGEYADFGIDAEHDREGKDRAADRATKYFARVQGRREGGVWHGRGGLSARLECA